MTKALLVALNLLFFLTYKLFLGGELSIEQDFPETANAGETFTVEVTINKGDREGFAKWQQTLPQGFIASAKETAGATFSYKNQELKLIWMAIPKAETFTISYEIRTDPTIEGSFELSGQFSFIEDNQRKDLNSNRKAIRILGKKALAEKGEKTSPKDEKAPPKTPDTSFVSEVKEARKNIPDSNSTKDLETAKENATEKLEPNETVVADESKIRIKRKITPLDSARYEVKLSINKSSLNSFGKIEEYLPPNYIASEGESQNAMFSFNRNVAKFLWMVLPDDDLIEITYFIESTSDELDEAVVHGVFSYLVDDDPMQLKLSPSTFVNTYQEPLAQNTQDTSKKDIGSIAEKASQEEEITEAVPAEKIKEMEEEEKKEESEELIDEVTDIPAPETDISYKVQIAAGKKEVKQIYFERRHNIREKVSIEYHESWYKYTIGGFPIYKQARDKRNLVWETDNKIDDAFVTAYNAGERISVQEALMISQQKWYK